MASVYLVLYVPKGQTNEGNFLLFTKVKKGYWFFSNDKGSLPTKQIIVYKDGFQMLDWQGPDNPALPGGDSEGQPLLDAAKREFKEETSIVLDDDRDLYCSQPILFNTFHYNYKGMDSFYYAVYYPVNNVTMNKILVNINLAFKNAETRISQIKVKTYVNGPDGAWDPTRETALPWDNELTNVRIKNVINDWGEVSAWEYPIDWYKNILNYLSTEIHK
jgi:8-oxo-dGTP pyrophosphatase MutT (NUDIX family)